MTGPRRVLVVGDVMLDRYIHGDVTRISPEAPVPVVKVTRQEDRLGGAANVAANVVALGGQATLAGVVGADDAGRQIRTMAPQAGIAIVLQTDARMPTTVKTRVIGGHQQMLRMDSEGCPDFGVLRWLYQDIDGCEPDVIVLSDYGKGVLADAQEIIDRARCPVLVDPKGADWVKYHGATLIKPNAAELRAVIGDVTDDGVQALRRSLEVQAILVTDGAAGMTLHWDGDPIHVSAHARSVFDVTGAGDTVIAAMAVAYPRLLGCSEWAEAMRFASAAAGIVVGKVGTATASAADVRRALNA